MKGKLYLLPTTLGENEPLEVMPYSVKTMVELIDHYIVENEKSARRFIKKIAPKKSQPSLTIMKLDKYAEELFLYVIKHHPIARPSSTLLLFTKKSFLPTDFVS